MVVLGVVSAVAQAASWQALVVNDLSTSNSVSPIDTGSNAAGSMVPVGDLPLGIAISPNARTAYVVNAGATGSTGQVTPLDLSTSPPTAEPTIDIPGDFGNYIAISPNGHEAYVSDPTHGEIWPIDLTSSPPAPQAPIAVGGNPEWIAFSPDGTTAYVAENDGTSGTPEVLPIDVASATIGSAITGVGPHPFALAITPNGRSAYVTDSGPGANKVYPITLSMKAVGTPIEFAPSAEEGSVGIAIAPDGDQAYVTNYAGATLVPISLPSDTPGSPISLPGTHPYAVAVTPDGRTAYVSDGAQHGDTVTPVDLSTDTPGTPITVGEAPHGIAITPDQGPVANFTVAGAAPGSASSFDASASTVAFGSIESYEWEFGDGSAPVSTNGPTVSHVYANAGSYTTTVTEADELGIGTNGETFTGQTASYFGNPLATTSKSVVIAATQPTFSASASSLDFGTVGVGQSAPQTLKISNTGNAPLTITASGLSGLGASGFARTSDGCTGATIPAGASCSVVVSFTPLSSGAFSAQLAFVDNASGSPHIVNLTGSATAFGAIAGTVTSQAGTSAPAPLAGVTVLLCHPGELECSTHSAAANGTYEIASLTPGAYHIEFYPPAGSTVLNAAINVNVTAGAAVSVSPTLHTPRRFPTGVTTSTPAGDSFEGLPVVYGNQPYQLDFPFDVDPAASALKPGPPSPCVYSVLTVSLEFSTDPGVNGGQTYSYTGTQKLVMVYDKGVPHGYTFETPEGDYLLTPTTQVVDQQVPGGGEVTWSLVGGGASLQVSFSGAEAIFGASGLQVHGIIHQHADFKNAWSCEVEEGGDEDESEGEQEVDPSGFVRSTTGIPLQHAKVTLQSEGAAHKFTAPRAGQHSVFDPAINPEFSDQLGHYGWNVVPGHYRTTVSHPKCASVVSRTVTVPPPVTNLSVRLRCHGLTRARSQLALKVLGKPRAKGGAVLQVTVRSRGSRPQGEVKLTVAHRTLSVPLNAHGVALVAVPGLSLGNTSVKARYLGDATHAGTSGGTRLRVLAAAPRKALPGHAPRR
jgi:YVTN family beta-propeller protein